MKLQYHILVKMTCVLMLVSSIAVNSCSDALERAPDGKISLEDVFKDNEMVAAYLNSCYRYIPGGGHTWFFRMRGPVVWCDEAWDVDADGGEVYLPSLQLYNGLVSANNHFTEQIYPELGNNQGNAQYWSRFWAGIRQCSYFLANIDDAQVTNEVNRSRWKAEAHLLRAFYYAELLRWYGCSLPIVREPVPLDYDFSTLGRSSYYDVVKFIIEDCNEALKSPDLPWRITTSAEQYRFTKAVAEAIKSRMILYAASTLYNDGQNHWEEAFLITEAAYINLKANGYDLYNTINYPAVWNSVDACLPNYEAALFNEYFCNSMEYSATPVDRETIYQTRLVGDYSLFLDEGIGCQHGYRSGTCPSQELVDCFEVTNGTIAYPILNLAKPYHDEVTHLLPNFNVENDVHNLYDEQNPYVNRDPRFYASIYYNGSQRRTFWPFDESELSVENYPASSGVRTRIIATWEGEPRSGIHPTARPATRTGYYIRKFLHPNSGDNNRILAAAPKAFRLAEVILNYAEAAAEAGHLAEALAAVNEIRRRVNMPEIPASISQEDLILRIRNERRVELALEGFRYFDVRRWTSPDGDLEKTDRWVNAIWITNPVQNPDGSFSYTYTRGPVSRERLCYSHKFLRLPIPMNEANNMQALTGEIWQNPGW